MPTLIDRLLGRDTAQKAVVTGTGGTGPGITAYYNDAPLWTVSRNPRRLMRQAQELYHEDLIIRAAEGKVSGKAAGLPWHLEDENQDEVTDESDPAAKAVRDWLEKPQASLTGRKQMGRRELWKLTHRHNGLCGTTFWFLDQRTLGSGTPLVTLYINPARMYPAQDDNGNLLGWKLDSDSEGNGGIPLDLEEVLQFQFDPPDWGHYGIGLVESAGSAAALAKSVDRHTATVYSGGGRLAGLISPKVGATVSPDDWAAAVRDWRNIANDPDSAKRLHVLRGPVDFVRTAATMQELAVEAVSKMSRDEKLALWGVPESQLPLPTAVGLNSGDTKGYDEAVLMQGAVHDRVTPFWETIQYNVLDKIADAGGPKLQLIIEEPEFDDDTPNFQRAQMAGNLPLTANQRLAMIGQDPLPDYDLNGEPLGVAIYLPSGLTLIGAGADKDGNLESPLGPSEDFDIESLMTEAAAIEAPVEAAPVAPPVPETTTPAQSPEDDAQTLRQRVDSAGVLIRSGFDPEGSLAAVGLDPIKHLGFLPITVKNAEELKAVLDEQDEIDEEVVDDGVEDDWGMGEPTKAAKPAPAFIFGRPNPAYRASASSGQVKTELDAIRKRAIAKFGKAPSAAAILATYKRNLVRKQKQAIAARSKKKFGKAPTDKQVEATLKRNVKRDPRLGKLLGTKPRATKARVSPFISLRKSLDSRITPAIERSVLAALKAQAKDIAAKVRAKGEHLAKRPSDVDAWWNPKNETLRMRRAIEPHLVGIADLVSSQVDKSFQPQKATIERINIERDEHGRAISIWQPIEEARKADNLLDNVSEFVRKRGTERIPGILETTRESINRLIVDGFTSGLGPSEVAASIEVATAFNESRAELIARTESMLAFNESALQSFSEFGVDRVEAIDGDEDEVCAERNGQVFDVSEAMAIEDHPNGTLDWAPVI